MKKKQKRLFQKLPFYNVLIEKPLIKHLKKIYLLHDFYIAFKRYARIYKIEIIDSKDPLVQLEASKSNIKDLFKDLLHKIKGLKYQITLRVLLGKFY